MYTSPDLVTPIIPESTISRKLHTKRHSNYPTSKSWSCRSWVRLISGQDTLIIRTGFKKRQIANIRWWSRRYMSMTEASWS